jgi:hypothetical protein
VGVAFLPEHRDVDTPDDLRHLAACLASGPRKLAPATREALSALEAGIGARAASLGRNPREM